MRRQVAFLLMILVSASGFLTKPKEPPYQQFRKFSMKHIMEEPLPKGECFNVLREKGINQNGLKCKTTNSFIHAPLEEVVRVCEGGATEKDGLTKSKGRFNMTVCSVTKKGVFPKCKYKDKVIEAKILIRCLPERLPVHFQGSPNDGRSEVLFWSEK